MWADVGGGSLFLYTLLAGLFGIAGYFAYTMWEASVAPKKPKRKFETPKPVAPKQEEVEASGAKYEESWIPEHHLKRPGTKAKGGRGKKSIGAGSE